MDGGDISPLFFVPFLALVGAGFLIPLAFVPWIVPSAVAFAVARSVFLRRLSARAAQCAGAITAAFAAGSLTKVLTHFAQDWDGAGAMMAAIEPAAVLIAPIVARFTHA